jgi:phosphoglycolate phosphatase-like HAD superfamily hydrolase
VRSDATVAFDFDGTLVDSMSHLRELAVTTIIENVDDAPTGQDIRLRYDTSAGETFYDQLAHILPLSLGYTKQMWEDCAHVYECKKRPVTMEAPLWFDVPRTIPKLWERATLWVVSSTETDLVVNCLDRLDLWRYFDGCLGPRMGNKSRKLEMCRADYFVGDTNRDRFHAAEATRYGPKRVKFLGVQRDPKLLDDDDSTFKDMRVIVDGLLRIL